MLNSQGFVIFQCLLCSGVRPVAASSGHCARQPGAARLGHHPLGQRLRRVGPPALPCAGEGAVDPGALFPMININKIFLLLSLAIMINYSGGQHPQHEVQGLLWAGADR